MRGKYIVSISEMDTYLICGHNRKGVPIIEEVEARAWLTRDQLVRAIYTDQTIQLTHPEWKQDGVVDRVIGTWQVFDNMPQHICMRATN